MRCLIEPKTPELNCSVNLGNNINSSLGFLNSWHVDLENEREILLFS